MLTRVLLLTLGWVSIVLGVIGIFLPVLPTTPFILLAAWCFSRSSQRFHHWLRHHKHFGLIVRTWEDGKGISRKIRTRALVLLWVSLVSSSLIMGRLWVAIVLLLTGSAVTLYMMSLPVVEEVPMSDPVNDRDAD